MPILPPAGQLRTLSWATLANTVGSGLWLAGVALFLTRSVGLPATSVGTALTVAGLVGLTASVPLGQLADRRDPRTVRAVLQLAQAAVAGAYLLVDSFATLLLVATLDALLTTGNLTVRAALVAAVAGAGQRVRAFATLRAVANVGISVGAGLAGLALVADSPLGYAALVLGNAVTYLISAALLLRLPAFPPPSPPTPTAPTRPGPAPAGTGGSRVAVRTGGPRVAVLRDGPFLAVSAASAVLSLHEVVLGLILPLWIVNRIGAPGPVVSAVLVTNTVLTVLLAVRLGSGAERATSAARLVRRAGVLLAVAMLLYAAAATLPISAAVALLLVTTIGYTVGDLWHGNGSTGLGYDLAEPGAVGRYQGVAGLLTGLARATGPALLTVGLLAGHAMLGWLLLSAVFALAGLVTPALTRWAEANRAPRFH